MRLNDDTLVAGNFGETAQLQIRPEDAWTAIKILISQYQHPLTSAIREALQNAEDAKWQAGSERSTRIVAPTALQPSLSVRDYGTGLSYEDMLGLYANVGASTKRADDDQIGGFGIGRLSALAYAESFVVTSYWYGEAHTFFISMEGVHFAGTEPTDEPNGLKVEFDVAPGDFRAVADFLRSYVWYSTFDLDVVNIEVPEIQTWVGDGYRVFAKHPEGERLETLICMGGILYQVAWYRAHDHGYDVRQMARWGGLVIDMPIGALTPVPSREALELSPASDKQIAKALQRVDRTLNSLLLDGLTLPEQMNLVASNFSGYGLASRFSGYLARESRVRYPMTEYKLSSRNQSGYVRVRTRGNWNWYSQLTGSGFYILLDDLGSKSRQIKRTLNYLKDLHGTTRVIVISPKDYQQDELCKEMPTQRWSAVLQAMKTGHSAAAKRARVAYKPRAGYKYSGYGEGRSSWTAVPDLPENPMYVVISNFKVVTPLWGSTNLELLAKLLPAGEALYGVTPTNVPEDGTLLTDYAFELAAATDFTPLLVDETSRVFFSALRIRPADVLREAGVDLIEEWAGNYPEHCRILARLVPMSAIRTAALTYAQQLNDLYPLLTEVYVGHSAARKAAVDYIRLVNAQFDA